MSQSEEASDEYQTDYDEEAVESALSDFEAFAAGSEHTEGEETADTAETVRSSRQVLYPRSAHADSSQLIEVRTFVSTGRGYSEPSSTPAEECPAKCAAMTPIGAGAATAKHVSLQYFWTHGRWCDLREEPPCLWYLLDVRGSNR